MRSILACALAALVTLAPALSVPALAQSDAGEIRIFVVDAASKKPIELARVLLDGAVITSELTSKSGEVHFVDVPDGIYRARIIKRGYSPLSSAQFEVLNGRLVTVNVALVEDTGGLKIIGTVSVKASATISSTSINENSAQRKLSDDLAGALNKLSGVSVQTTDDSDTTQTVSLEGHDASQTALTLDGIPLNAPGSAGNLGAFATDLFGGASVRQGQQLGGAGGSVNFSTLQPTLSWQTSSAFSTGTNGKYNYSIAESGSAGKLGVAAQNVYRVNPSWVNGDYYLDASGLAYAHDGESTISGNLLRTRYEFSDAQTLSGTFLNSARSTNLVCLRYNGDTPCGLGPDNYNNTSVQLYALTDNALVGATQIQASVYSSTNATLNDQTNRYVDTSSGPAYEPTGFSTLNQTRGFTLNAGLPAKERHTISFQGYGTWSTQATTPLVAQAVPYYGGSTRTDYAAFQATDTIRSSDKLTLTTTLGASNGTGSAGATAIGSFGAAWRPTPADTFSGSLSVGGIAPTAGRSQILTDPLSIRFDCNGNVGYGFAPGQEPQASSSNQLRVGYTHAIRNASVTVAAYDQVQNGVLLPVYVNGATLKALGVLPFGYVEQVRRLFHSPGGCNEPATAFDASNLYFTTPIAGVQRDYQGGSITGFATLGDFVIQPYYDINVAKAISNNPLFQNPYSITISGSQLPNVPLHRAGVVLDYKAPHSILEWLADAQYVGANNPNNLPAYTTFDAGVSAQFAYGTLTFAASNITGTYAGIFAGPANAVPYQTLSNGPVGTTARPLQPTAVSVTYAVKFGQGVVAPTGRSLTPPRGAGGGGGFRNAFAPLPSAPPAEPFAINSDGQRCTAANAPKAQQLATELKAFVAQIEAAKSNGAYPASMAPPALTDATLTYHGLGDTYALTVTPKGSGGLRAIAGCLPVHIARADDVASHKLFAPNSTLFFVPQLNFMPSVGLYFVARQQQAGQESFRLYKLPTSAPSDPFALHEGTACTPEAKALASPALAELRARFGPAGAAAKTASWTIAEHPAKSGSWYSLEPGDPSLTAAILMCGRVAASTGDELAQRGYDGAAVPALNYAPALGLYLVRPNRPPGGQRP